MPRSKEQNEQARETTKGKILDTALSLYVIFGYNGTDMDTVAGRAGVAKGLLYYYFKTKNILFRELFNKVLSRTIEFSESFFDSIDDMNPVEKLIKYSMDIFGIGFDDPRYIQFAMRMPFDAYAVFGSEEWSQGLEGSKKHTENLEKIISEGISQGFIKCNNAKNGANSFWTVYVASLFNFTKMMAARGNDLEESEINIRMEEILSFGMAGLGVDRKIWVEALQRYNERKTKNESI